MKKIIVCILAAIAFAAGVLWFVNTQCLSPKETVEQYFTHFNSKDEKGMLSLTAKSFKDKIPSVAHLEYVHLRVCFEETQYQKDLRIMKKKRYPKEKYLSKVYTVFDIQYIEDAPDTVEFDDGVNYLTFYLTKQSEYSPWRILSIKG